MSHFNTRKNTNLIATTALTAVSMFVLSSAPALADNWVDLNDVAGSTSTTVNAPGSTTDITINSGRAVVEGDLDINAGWSVNVGAGDLVAIDRENDPTFIFGSLNCAGTCHVLDANGVIVGAGGSVDAQSVTLSTGEMTNTAADFVANGDLVLENNQGAAGSVGVQNLGTVSVGEAGLAAFVSSYITNSGTINAKLGRVEMASGNKVTLDLGGDGLVEVVVDGELADALIKNDASGRINAEGGTVRMTALAAKNAVDNIINVKGIVNVTSATQKGGKIILSGGTKGTVQVKDATLDAKSNVEGGTIELTGQNISVTGASKLDVSSATNAGTIGLEAENNASISQRSELDADSAGGEAGVIRAVAKNRLRLFGDVHAQGANKSGFIETKGSNIQFNVGTTSILAGDWLLHDTGDVLVEALYSALLSNQLDFGGDATVKTTARGSESGNIDLAGMTTWSTGNNLTVDAANDLSLIPNGAAGAVGGGINATGAGNVSLSGGDDVRLKAGNAGIKTNTGNIDIVSTDEFTLVDGSIESNGGNIVIENEVFQALAGTIKNDNGGQITLNQNKGTANSGNITDATIQNAVYAIDNAGNGKNLINVGAGTFAESVNINTAMQIRGAGVADTIIDATGENNGFQITSNLGNAVVSLSDMTVQNANNSGATVTNSGALKRFEMNRMQYNNNGNNGVSVFGNGLGDLRIFNSDFYQNGADMASATSLGNGDILAFLYNGDATLKNVNVHGYATDGANFGIQFRGSDAVAAAGDVTFDNVNVSGSYRRPSGAAGSWSKGGPGAGIALFTYADTSTITFKDVTLNVNEGHGIQVDGLGDGVSSLDIGNTVFKAQDHDTALGGIGGSLAIPSQAIFVGTSSKNPVKTNVDATSATFEGATDDFAIEDRILHALDSDALGLVTWKENNVFVTQKSGSIQRGVDAASSGFTVNVDAGSFSSVVVDKSLILLGNNAGIDGAGIRNAETIVDPNSPVFTVTADDVTIDGFMMTGGSSDVGVIAENVDRTTIKNNIMTSLGDGVFLRNNDSSVVSNNWIHDLSDDGIQGNNADNITVANNTIERMGDAGIAIINQGGNGSSNPIITGNKVDIAIGFGIRASGTSNVNISGNEVTNSGDAARDFQNDAIHVDGGYTSGTINGNTIKNVNDDAGIELDGVSGLIVNANNIDGEGSTAFGIKIVNSSDIVIGDEDGNNDSGNVVKNVDVGVYVNGGSNYTIVDNEFSDSINGIVVDGINGASIRNNIVNNNTDTESGRRTSGYVTGIGILIKDSNGEIEARKNKMDANTDAIRVSGTNAAAFGDIKIYENTIKNSLDKGIIAKNSDQIRVFKNTLNGNKTGVWLEDSDNSYVNNNDITNSTQDAIHLRTNSDGNTIRNNRINGTSNAAILVEAGSDNVSVEINKIGLTGGADNIKGDAIVLKGSNNSKVTENEIQNATLNAIKIDGGTMNEVRGNIIAHIGQDGIRADSFGKLWVSYNEIKNTGDDGVDAHDGDFISVYNNYFDLIGFKSTGPHSNENVGKDANAIHIVDVTGESMPAIDTLNKGFDSSTYGAAAEVYGNDIANVEDDGIQVVDSASTYITENVIGHTGDDGVDIDNVGVSYVTNNAITMVGDRGITIHAKRESEADIAGRYAGVFDNRILLAGGEGIHIGDIYGGQDSILLGDIVYGFGSSVNVSGNEVALVGDDGIEVHNSGPTTILDNGVFMAGLGEQQMGGLIGMVNQFASGSFAFAPNVARAPAQSIQNILADVPSVEPSFDLAFGNGNGIYVHDVYGASNAPTGWAVDIRRNDVKWTGGHGIAVENADRTRIQNNDVNYAGVANLTLTGKTSLSDVLQYGPFVSPERRDLWADQPSMIAVFEGYLGAETTPAEPKTDYITVSGVAYDAHDGIHVQDVYSDNRSDKFALKIKNNRVQYTGDDGIDVNRADRTLIELNRIRDAGHGGSIDYGSGDYHGADGIYVSDVGVEFSGKETRRAGVLGQDIILDSNAGFPFEPNSHYSLIIRDNDIRRTSDDGIEVEGGYLIKRPVNAETALAFDIGPSNMISSFSDRTLIAGNTIRRTGENSEDLLGADGRGHDGIHVNGIQGEAYRDISWDINTLETFSAIPSGNDGNTGGKGGGNFYGYAVDIIENDVRRAGDDGIEVTNSNSVLIHTNDVRRVGGDGIMVRNTGERSEGMSMTGYAAGGLSGDAFTPYTVAIFENDVRRAGDDGIQVDTTFFAPTELLMDGNDVNRSGNNGIEVNANGIGITIFNEGNEVVDRFYFGGVNSNIVGNTVNNSNNVGISVNGYGHDHVTFAGNMMTDNATGARFESGEVDLTNEENANAVAVNTDFTPFGKENIATGFQFELAGSGDPTILSLKENTLGTTEFNGFANRPVGQSYYVRLENGSFLTREGGVIEVDATNVNFDGLIPSAQGNILSANDLAVIENRLFDADDSPVNGRGQIFVGAAIAASDSIDNIEDFFEQFGPLTAAGRGFSLRVTGLPPVGPTGSSGNNSGTGGSTGFTAADLAGIEPAAGGDESGAGVAGIEPAAGNEATCWGEVIQGVVNGAVDYNVSGDAASILAAEASCGS